MKKLTEKELKKWVNNQIDFLASIMACNGRRSEAYKEWRDSFIEEFKEAVNDSK